MKWAMSGCSPILTREEKPKPVQNQSVPAGGTEFVEANSTFERFHPFSDYNGLRPRVLLFHGMNDTTIPYFNMEESIKEWSNVLGLPEPPTSEDTIGPPDAGYDYNIQIWKDDCDFTLLEAWSSPGNGHSMQYEEEAILRFFGLDEFDCVDPQLRSCSDN